MNEERKMILEMLKDGKINVDEASDLLEAVGSNKSNRGEDSFINKLSNSFEKVLKKTGETISNIDFESMTNPSNLYHISSIAVDNETKIEDDIEEISVDILSGKLQIERAQENYILVDQTVFFKEKDEEVKDYLEIETEDGKLSISVNPKYKDYQASANVKLQLGKNVYDKLTLDVVNGEIEVCDVDFTNSNIESVNGKITVINSAGDIFIKNTNGKIEVKNTNGSLDVNNINGSIYLTNVSGNAASLEAVNGSIRVDGIKSDKLLVNSKSGSIRVSKLENISNIGLNSGFGTVVLDTEGYGKDVSVTIKSTNYSISDKFKNKIQREEGYQISTNPDKTDLRADIQAGFGKVIVK